MIRGGAISLFFNLNYIFCYEKVIFKERISFSAGMP